MDVAPEQVTVVIPAFNPGPYLDEALGSVGGQTFPPGRVILIDDGSEPPLRVDPGRWRFALDVIRQPNAGQASGRNLGISLARTDWVAFLDADDVWHPRKLERQMQTLREHPGAGCVGCRSVLIDGAGVPFGLGPGAFAGGAVPLDRPAFIAQAAEAVLVPSMAVLSRAVCQALPGFDRSFQPIEDLVFFDGFFRAGGQALLLDEPLLQRRMHGSNLTFRYRDMLRSYLKWAGNLDSLPSAAAPAGLPSPLGLADRLRASAYLVTGLSALAGGRADAARRLLRKALRMAVSLKALAAFGCACLGPTLATAFRQFKHRAAGRRATALWAAAGEHPRGPASRAGALPGKD